MPKITGRLWIYLPAVMTAIATAAAVAEQFTTPAQRAAAPAEAEAADMEAEVDEMEDADGEPVGDADEEPAVDDAGEARVVHPQLNIAAFARRYRSFAVDGGGESATLVAIERALAGRTDDRWDFVETPLRDVVRHVQVSLDVPVTLDLLDLEEAGLDADTPVTFRGQGERVGAALHRMLEPLDLAITIADEALVVTTTEACVERLVPRIYPVPCGLEAGAAESVVDLVQSTVDVDTWDAVGGFAAIRFLGPPGSPLLVITQTLAGHDRVESLLATIHARGLAEFAAADGGEAAPVARVHRVEDDAMRAELAASLVELCNRSLGGVGDPDAMVTDLAGSLVVQSGSPKFQACAAQMIAAVAGIRATSSAASEFPEAF